MKNLTIKIFLILLGSLLSVSCLDETVRDYGQGPLVVQFKNASVTETFVKNGNVTDYSVPVIYYGGDNKTFTENLTATVAVHSSSTAKEGVEFTIPNKTVSISAGSNTANVVVKINTAALNVAATPKLVLQIVQSNKAISTSSTSMTTVNIKSKNP